MILSACWGGELYAQTVGDFERRTFSAERLRLMSDSGSNLGLLSAELGQEGDWDFGLWAHYSNASITLEQSDGEVSGARAATLLGGQFSSVATGSYAIRDYLRIHGRAKMIFFQDRDTVLLDDLGFSRLPAGAVADPIIGLRFQSLDKGTSVAMGLEISTPYGTPTDSYNAEQSFTYRPEAMIELPIGPVRFLANASVLFRKAVQIPEFSMTIDDELNLSAMFEGGYQLAKHRHIRGSVGFDLHRGLAFSGALASQSGLEARAGLDFAMNKTVSFRGGAGFALDGGVGVPDYRGYLAIVFSHQGRHRPAETKEDLDGFAVCYLPREPDCISNDPSCIAPGPPYCLKRAAIESPAASIDRRSDPSSLFQLTEADETGGLGLLSLVGKGVEWWERIEPIDESRLCKAGADETSIYFPIGAELSTAAYRKLDRFVATLLRREYTGKIQVTGYDSADGVYGAELAARHRLAVARARTVRNYLSFRELDIDQLLPYQAALTRQTDKDGFLLDQRVTLRMVDHCGVAELSDDVMVPKALATLKIELTEPSFIWIDNKPNDSAVTEKIYELPEGEYIVRVKLNKDNILETRVKLQSGDKATLRFDFSDQSAELILDD